MALAVYLTGLLLSIAGNSVSGSSAFVRTVKQRLFSPWMGPAWLDLGFDQPLTYGMLEDGDHGLEIRGAATAAAAPIRLPGSRTGERAARWRRLARRIALAADDETGVALAAGVGQGSFEAIGDDVVVRAVRWPLADREAASAVAARPVKPYEARVRRVAGETQLVELGGEAKRPELAPVLRREPAPPSAAERDPPP